MLKENEIENKDKQKGDMEIDQVWFPTRKHNARKIHDCKNFQRKN